ncbi:helix-turn-helix domain-containing protein [Ectobacillus ponti]|uniref:Helix-turn-helix domain-containing protein n=1 Tax=Ectobacillus ponti TaxID=2961894 RepID=A0AA42BNE6_9BACI|nr:helix-turn-helix domain-containing protein [Ectobacillus ponti]MCP8967361.1 helix-turn-helix domain-containing protein [Ectobacillus ponti]
MNRRIREIRKRHGDTLKSLAKKINYDYSNLSKIERGIYNPSLALLQKIADVYAISIHEFIETDKEQDYGAEDTQFVQELNLDSQRLTQQYKFLLDGQPITQEELEFMTDIVRKLRKTLEKK